MIWELKQGGSWVAMPTPASYTIEANDLDDESYRNVKNGSVVRQLVSRMWQKMSFTFAFKTEAQCKDIIDKLNANTEITIRCKSPIMTDAGNDGWKTMNGYVSQFNVEMVNTGAVEYDQHGTPIGSVKGYTFSFAFVEAYRS